MEDFVGLLTLFVLAATVLYFFGLVWWKIFSKAGHPGPLGLLMFVPFLNLIMLCVLAFGEWPIQRELEHTKRLLPAKHQTVFDRN
jgi:hypothetical protein